MSDSSLCSLRCVVTVVTVGLGCTSASIAAAQTQDCALGERYLMLAKDRIAAYETADAITLLKQATSVCSQYETQQQLGELAAQQPEEENKRIAVEAFVAAHALATTPAAEARTLYEYAALLAREGDPQNAHPLAIQARGLNPNDEKIVALEAQLAQQVANPTVANIRAGLRSSLYEPLMAARSSTSPQPGGASPPPSYGPSINIPMNFLSGRIELDPETRPNVTVLAEALADPGYADDAFVFIGHADVRGDAETNRQLSIQRAEAIRQIVTTLQPSLSGRISAEGRGESQPLDPGNDERAFRANRRLQVMIER